MFASVANGALHYNILVYCFVHSIRLTETNYVSILNTIASIDADTNLSILSIHLRRIWCGRAWIYGQRARTLIYERGSGHTHVVHTRTVVRTRGCTRSGLQDTEQSLIGTIKLLYRIWIVFDGLVYF